MARKKDCITTRRITAAYNKVAAGVSIDIMEIPRIWDAAEAAVKSGADDTSIEKAIAAVLETLNKG